MGVFRDSSYSFIMEKLLIFCLFLALCDAFNPKTNFPNNIHYAVPHSMPSTPSNHTYQTYYYKVQLDHFGFDNSKTFPLRYLVNDVAWNKNGGPIFFYTGNEGDIELFLENTGFMWDIAPDFKAMLVFAEHRYYGKSLPFGSDTYKNLTNLNYFTSEQALADFAELIRFMKATIPGADKSPVIAFGGSYGGMLAAWLRFKYPNVVIGALAASAPIWQFTDLTPCNAFYDTTAATWERASKACVTNLHNSYSTLDSFATATGFTYLSQTFHTCTPLKTKDDLVIFKDYLTSMYVNFAMVDYPYPANFIANLPGWPVKVACSYLSSALTGKVLIEGVAQVTNLYFNHTGDLKCLDWTSETVSGQLGIQGWNYQSCTEMAMPMCSKNNALFPDIPWNFTAFSDSCYQSYKIRPRENWISLQYWGKSLSSASNIIFSNGDLDPWSSGGVKKCQGETVIALLIQNGAHHLDLRSANKLDPPSVKNARMTERYIMQGWLRLTT